MEAPLARSRPDLVFSAPLQGSGVALVTRLSFRVFVMSRPVPSDDASEIAASDRISAEANAGCGGHIHELDAATLSAECQQPCQ